jgi:hypothetical protein
LALKALKTKGIRACEAESGGFFEKNEVGASLAVVST